MSAKSSIEWTDATWNPIRGCTKVSPGCKHCYAETFAERFRGVEGHPLRHGFDVTFVPEKLDQPIKWQKSRRIFVNSMSDLFHEAVPTWYIREVLRVMRLAPWHVYQVLTKRPGRLVEIANYATLRHAGIGVSVEDRQYGLPRIEHLRGAKGFGFRFLSIEPLLEDLGPVDLTGIDWVIVGGESGPKARPLEADWVRSIRDQCLEQDVRFFFKQWGGRNKKAAGRELDGRTYDEMPAVGIEKPRRDRSEQYRRLYAITAPAFIARDEDGNVTADVRDRYVAWVQSWLAAPSTNRVVDDDLVVIRKKKRG